MIVALAMEMQAAGIEYRDHLHVTAIDVDPRAAHMAYVQFTLLHIPAVVIVGNTLTLEVRETWPTFAHASGLWSWKLKRGYALGSAADPAEAGDVVDVVPASAPVAAAQLDLFGAAVSSLTRLVTPPGGIVLDPFAGSGSTGRAADIEGFDAILIELNPEYAAIARKRVRGDAPLFAESL